MLLLAPPRMGRGAQRFAFACASTSQEPSRSSFEPLPSLRPLYALLRLYRSRPGHTALSGSSPAVSGDYRSCEVVNTSLSPEQTGPEALGALVLQLGAQTVALVPQRPRLFFEGRLCPFGQLQPRPQVRSLRASLDHLGGEVADEFREVFRARGLLADFVRTLPRRIPRVSQGL